LFLATPAKRALDFDDASVDGGKKASVTSDVIKEVDVMSDVFREVDVMSDAIKEVDVMSDAIKEVDVTSDACKEVNITSDVIKEVDVKSDAIEDVNVASDAVREVDVRSDAVKEVDVTPDAVKEANVTREVIREVDDKPHPDDPVIVDVKNELLRSGSADEPEVALNNGADVSADTSGIASDCSEAAAKEPAAPTASEVNASDTAPQASEAKAECVVSKTADCSKPEAKSYREKVVNGCQSPKSASPKTSKTTAPPMTMAARLSAQKEQSASQPPAKNARPVSRCETFSGANFWHAAFTTAIPA
jgi:hypothetical protein